MLPILIIRKPAFISLGFSTPKIWNAFEVFWSETEFKFLITKNWTVSDLTIRKPVFILEKAYSLLPNPIMYYT
jgi:hypothetical protein